MIKKNWKAQNIVLLLGLIVLLTVPVFGVGNYYISILVYCLAFAALGSA